MDEHRYRVDRNLRDVGVKLRMDGFAWEAVQSEAAREHLSVEEFITFSVLYYLADLDSGRISRRISRSPYPNRPAPDDGHADGSDAESPALPEQAAIKQR